MAARRPKALAKATAPLVPDVKDPQVSRAIQALKQTVVQVAGRADYDRVQADLAIGKNAVHHSLGRAPTVVLVTPTVADAGYAYAVTDANERQVILDVIGAAQPRAWLFLM